MNQRSDLGSSFSPRGLIAALITFKSQFTAQTFLLPQWQNGELPLLLVSHATFRPKLALPRLQIRPGQDGIGSETHHSVWTVNLSELLSELCHLNQSLYICAAVHPLPKVPGIQTRNPAPRARKQRWASRFLSYPQLLRGWEKKN